jgi:quinoprotein glucose dehydrogenase
MKTSRLFLSLLLTASFAAGQSENPGGVADQWPTYGGDAGGSRYSTSAQINKNNVSRLRVAWTFH